MATEIPNGFTEASWKNWKSAKFSPAKARAWRKAGISSLKGAWIVRAGGTLKDAKILKNVLVTSKNGSLTVASTKAARELIKGSALPKPSAQSKPTSAKASGRKTAAKRGKTAKATPSAGASSQVTITGTAAAVAAVLNATGTPSKPRRKAPAKNKSAKSSKSSKSTGTSSKGKGKGKFYSHGYKRSLLEGGKKWKGFSAEESAVLRAWGVMYPIAKAAKALGISPLGYFVLSANDGGRSNFRKAYMAARGKDSVCRAASGAACTTTPRRSRGSRSPISGMAEITLYDDGGHTVGPWYGRI
jgi:hypothetical protein